MADSQVTNGMYFCGSLESDGIKISYFGVLKVEFHDVGVACGEDDLRYLVGSFEVVRVGVVEVVEEGLESVLVSWRADLAGNLGKLQQDRGL